LYLINLIIGPKKIEGEYHITPSIFLKYAEKIKSGRVIKKGLRISANVRNK
jgi:hypothetical protein